MCVNNLIYFCKSVLPPVMMYCKSLFMFYVKTAPAMLETAQCIIFIIETEECSCKLCKC